ncbi:phage baseplate protein [Salmonella enterica]
MDILSTLFQQQSRKIEFIIPDVIVTEKHVDTLEITQHPVEMGAPITDHAYKLPGEVVMEVGFAGGGLLGKSPQERYQQLLDLQAKRLPFDVITGKRIYKNMLLRAIEVSTDVATENVLSATLTLSEVLITNPQVVYVADKQDMKEGATTSAIAHTGTKTPTPPEVSLLYKIKGVLSDIIF